MDESPTEATSTAKKSAASNAAKTQLGRRTASKGEPERNEGKPLFDGGDGGEEEEEKDEIGAADRIASVSDELDAMRCEAAEGQNA